MGHIQLQNAIASLLFKMRPQVAHPMSSVGRHSCCRGAQRVETVMKL